MQLEEAVQGKPSAKYWPTHLVVDAALWPIGKTRHGEHKIANISVNCQRIWKRISPMDSAYFSGGSGGWKKFFPTNIFFCFQNLDALYGPVAGKPFVLEDFVFGMGTSVASALTAETVFEIMKCMSDVDMPACVCTGSKAEILRFFNSGYVHDINIWIFRCRPSRVTGNTLIKPNYGSVRLSGDSLHRDRHTMKKKSRRRRALKLLELRSSKNSRRRVLWHITTPVNLV